MPTQEQIWDHERDLRKHEPRSTDLLPRVVHMIALRASTAEYHAARALGTGYRDAYDSSDRVMDGIAAIASAPMPAIVTGRFRPCR